MTLLSNILSWFSGGARPAAPQSLSVEPQIHGECRIYAEPIREGSQYRLAGRIEREVNGETLVRSFIRADVFSSADEAVEGTLRKARQIIDQYGPALFSDGEKSRRV